MPVGTGVGLALIALLLAGGVVIIFNALVRARAMAYEGWSGVEVQLQRRADLVPGLVQVVAAHAGHERGLFQEVAAQRSAALVADRQARSAAESDLTQALTRLVALAEA